MTDKFALLGLGSIHMTQIIPGLTSRLFDGHLVRFSITSDGPLFVVKDVCDALEIKDHGQAVSHMPDWGKGGGIQHPSLGGAQTHATMTLPGLFWFALRSNKPNAVKFQKWVCCDVLPSIQKHGFYVAQGVDPRVAWVNEGRMRIERARLLRREAAELMQQAKLLLRLDDGVTVGDIIAERKTGGQKFGVKSIASAARVARAWALRNNIPMGRDAKGRMTLPRAAMEKALDLDQRWLGLEG